MYDEGRGGSALEARTGRRRWWPVVKAGGLIRGVFTMSTITTKQPIHASPPRGMTVDEFEQLEESLGDVRIELIDGRVFERHDAREGPRR